MTDAHARSQRIGVGAIADGLEADAGAAAHQPGGDGGALVAGREQVCRRVGRARDRGVLFRGGERLVGVEAPEEAAAVNRPGRGLAPQLGAAGGGRGRRARARDVGLHQGRRPAAGGDGVGRAAALQHRVRRVRQRVGRLGARRGLLAVRRRAGLRRARLVRHRRVPVGARAAATGDRDSHHAAAAVRGAAVGGRGPHRGRRPRLPPDRL